MVEDNLRRMNSILSSTGQAQEVSQVTDAPSGSAVLLQHDLSGSAPSDFMHVRRARRAEGWGVVVEGL